MSLGMKMLRSRSVLLMEEAMFGQDDMPFHQKKNLWDSECALGKGNGG